MYIVSTAETKLIGGMKMKPEEALKNIGDWISEETEQRKYDKATVIELADSLITLKVAVNKQVAKKPEMYIGDYEFERWPICPKCNGELHPNGEKFCSDCGQAIDWSEIDE